MIVYSMLNQHNGKRYIGYTKQTLRKRREQHLNELRRNHHHNIHLQRAWNRGDRYFLWIILEVCDSVEETKAAEIKWIAHYDTVNYSIGYNLTYGGEGGNMTPDTRNKIRLSKIGKKRTPFSDETKQRMSMVRVGKPKSHITRERMSESHKKRRRPT